jgi:hypothetical protein
MEKLYGPSVMEVYKRMYMYEVRIPAMVGLIKCNNLNLIMSCFLNATFLLSIHFSDPFLLPFPLYFHRSRRISTRWVMMSTEA